MSEHTVDVAVLGMGPGGEAVAGTLGEAGLDVVGIDERLLGGECRTGLLRSHQDDDPRGAAARRGAANPRHGRSGRGHG